MPLEVEHWNREETILLLEVWGEDNVQSELEGMRRTKSIYDRISTRLRAKGVTRTGKQCVTKIKALKLAYRKVVDNNNVSGAKRKTCAFYNELDAILGNKPATRPKVLVDTSRDGSDTSDSEDDSTATDTAEIDVTGIVDDDLPDIIESTPNADTVEETPLATVTSSNTATATPENSTTTMTSSASASTTSTSSLNKKKPTVVRKPNVGKKRSIADAISLLASAQTKSDELFVKLEQQRIELDLQAEAKRQKEQNAFELRQLQVRQDFELKRLELMMKVQPQPSVQPLPFQQPYQPMSRPMSPPMSPPMSLSYRAQSPQIHDGSPMSPPYCPPSPHMMIHDGSPMSTPYRDPSPQMYDASQSQIHVSDTLHLMRAANEFS